MSTEREKERRIEKLDSLTKPNSLYFAHPIIFFNTELEELFVRKIIDFFPDYNLESPNQKHHQENYRFWKEKFGNGMEYYLGVVLPRMKAGIGLPFEDGMHGAGVFGELKCLYQMGKPIWEIGFNTKIRRISSIDELKALSLDETIKRIHVG